MTEYDNEMRGALFPNNKGDNPNRPDSRGRCTINGVNYRISGWKRTAQATGKPFISLAFTVDEETPTDPSPEKTSPEVAADQAAENSLL